jgi:hypothetical protein
MKRSMALGLLLVGACARREPPPAASPPPVVSLAPAVSAPPPATPPPSSAPPPAPAPKGTATLVLQRVESVCIVGVGALSPGTIPVGTDLLIETSEGDDGKPARDFVSCPKQAADGKPPKLGVCRTCRAYGACKVISLEGGADRVEVQCGKDHVVLEVSGGRTMLRGPSGEREIAPYPMKLLPPRKDFRRCDITC